MKVIKYDKLVRDNILDIIKEDGKQYVYEKLNPYSDEYHQRLMDKLTEEVNEYKESEDVRELADVLEIMHAILDYRGFDIDYINSIREDKNITNGGFGKGIVLKEVIEHK